MSDMIEDMWQNRKQAKKALVQLIMADIFGKHVFWKPDTPMVYENAITALIEADVHWKVIERVVGDIVQATRDEYGE